MSYHILKNIHLDVEFMILQGTIHTYNKTLVPLYNYIIKHNMQT